MRVRSAYFKREYDLHKAELIGQGNFAQVFRAFQPDLNDSIAIRRVKKSQADMEDINKEKQINDQLRKVENENILKIYDIIDQTEAVWYITEYCSGGSLWDALNLCKDNKMSEKEGLQCVLQISKGVQELHNHRITHRDLKPQNILLKTKYIPGKPLPLIKLADFGLSTQKIIMQTIAGTKEYIAPEQAKFHNYTNAVDVWSLGIIFDQILHGTPYYSGEDNKEVFNKILKMPFKVRDESLRQSIKELMVSLLKKKPYERPIIAVIRSTVETILLEIQTESKEIVSQETPDKRFPKKRGGNVNDSIRSSNGERNQANTTNSRDKQTPVMQSRKVYQVGVKQDEKPRIGQGFLKKELTNITPNNHSREAPPSRENQLSKNMSGIIAKQTPREGQKVITIGEIKEKKEKSEKKEDKELEQTKIEQSGANSPRAESTLKPVQPLQLTNQKISLFKADRRKMIVSNIKKEQNKEQIVDINIYTKQVYNSKKALLDSAQIKMEKELSFLPNTQLSGNEFTDKCGNTEETLKQFKKRMDFLNYFSLSEDYQIKLLQGRKQLGCLKDQARGEFESTSQAIKDIFFKQLDTYVDSYLERAIK